MRRETERDILRYIDFLRDAGYMITLSCLNAALLQSAFVSMLSYENHFCEVCLLMKSQEYTRAQCIKNKHYLIRHAKWKVAYDCCWAGVEEYVFPIIISEQLICRVHISGFRGKLQRSKRRAQLLEKRYGKKYTSQYLRLSEDVPTQEFLERLIQPLYHMYHRLLDETTATNNDEDSAQSLYLAITRFIHENYSENLRTEDIAQAVNYSPSYVRALFQKMNGKPIMEYLTDIRMSHASQLLHFTSFSVTKIAYECGFRDSNYFSTAFKKHFGVSPLAYRVNSQMSEKQS